jgi:hypothetical protein
VADHGEHREHKNDCSVRAFAVKPRAFGAPLHGFGTSARPSNQADRAAIANV